eukprot:UN00038
MDTLAENLLELIRSYLSLKELCALKGVSRSWNTNSLHTVRILNVRLPIRENQCDRWISISKSANNIRTLRLQCRKNEPFSAF